MALSKIGSAGIESGTIPAALPIVITPTNTSPANGATDQTETPTLESSTFYALYGYTHAKSQWQVSTSSSFSTTVVNTGDVDDLDSYTVPAGNLSTSTTYYWRVRYKDSNGDYSDWSTGTSFQTASSFAYNIDFLVVAGGGGYGASDSMYYRGGGGGGGMRSSYNTTGGSGSLESAISVSPGVSYTVTIGGGGSAGSSNGSNSVFSTITSTGGGKGGDRNTAGNSGGSGGGGGGDDVGGAGGSGTANQGYGGGAAQGGSGWAGGGGGGAAGAGSATVTNSGTGGTGGPGRANTITGSSIYYSAGGGGGAGFYGSQTPGTEGTGWANLANRGHGGKPVTNLNGSSGVVVLRIPTVSYSGTTTGSPSLSTDGSYTILTYTSSGSYTA